MISGNAKKMLEKQGWKEGMSLGKNGDGITKAIKVPLKMNSSGLGFQFGKEFTNDWWSSAYNNAVGKVQVSRENNSLSVKMEKTDKKINKESLRNRFRTSKDAVEELCTVKKDPLKMIKGITCHKAARHGIRMTGKLERIERQEKEMANLSSKEQLAESRATCQ